VSDAIVTIAAHRCLFRAAWPTLIAKVAGPLLSRVTWPLLKLLVLALSQTAVCTTSAWMQTRRAVCLFTSQLSPVLIAPTQGNGIVQGAKKRRRWHTSNLSKARETRDGLSSSYS